MKQIHDVLIIGAGVTGTMIARELSKYKLDAVIIDKSNDAGNLTSSANSAIIHSGYDPEPGTNKAKFNVLGNKMYPQIVKDLDVEYIPCGSLTIALEEEQLEILKDLNIALSCLPKVTPNVGMLYPYDASLNWIGKFEGTTSPSE